MRAAARGPRSGIHVFLYSNRRSRGHGLRRFRPYSAAFTVMCVARLHAVPRILATIPYSRPPMTASSARRLATQSQSCSTPARATAPPTGLNPHWTRYSGGMVLGAPAAASRVCSAAMLRSFVRLWAACEAAARAPRSLAVLGRPPAAAEVEAALGQGGGYRSLKCRFSAWLARRSGGCS